MGIYQAEQVEKLTFIAKNVFGIIFQITYFKLWKNVIIYLICMCFFFKWWKEHYFLIGEKNKEKEEERRTKWCARGRKRKKKRVWFWEWAPQFLIYKKKKKKKKTGINEFSKLVQMSLRNKKVFCMSNRFASVLFFLLLNNSIPEIWDFPSSFVGFWAFFFCYQLSNGAFR